MSLQIRLKLLTISFRVTNQLLYIFLPSTRHDSGPRLQRFKHGASATSRRVFFVVFFSFNHCYLAMYTSISCQAWSISALQRQAKVGTTWEPYKRFYFTSLAFKFEARTKKTIISCDLMFCCRAILRQIIMAVAAGPIRDPFFCLV